MTTAQEVFDYTIALMDEVSESGLTDTGDTAEYKNRTLFILNVLRGEFVPLSSKNETPRVIEDFDSNLDLDDYTCQTVLPYGLAAHLLLDENPSAAGFFQQRYDELKRRGMRVSGSEDIVDVYGGCNPYNEFSRW